MRRKINRKMLKKGQQKLSIRLCDGVIMTERIEYKGHHHVQKPRTFCKARIVSEFAFTPLGWTLTTRVVRELYPRNPKHTRNKLRCDKNARTSNASEKLRYKMINLVHFGVKLLDKHERTGDRVVTQWLPSPTVNDIGKVGVGEVRQKDLAFRMNVTSRKVLQECLVGIIITEPKRDRSRIRRWRSSGTKRVLSHSRFTLRCHRHD